MGCSASTTPKTPEEAEASQRTKQIDEALKKDKRADKEDFRILLLGAGESGKSTVLKQLQYLYASGLATPEERRRLYAAAIEHNLVDAFLRTVKALNEREEVLVTEMRQRGEAVPEAQDGTIPKEALDFYISVVRPVVAPASINAPGAGRLSLDLVSNLWKRFRDATSRPDSVAAALLLGDLSKMPGCPAYFMDAASRILAPGYEPTVEDCLRCRVRTTGIVETTLRMDSKIFRVVDVGGQRSDRRKWIHCFDNTNAVVFCASIVDYDRALEEKPSVNRMDENLTLFGETCNAQWFDGVPFVLFLNKFDLLPERLKASPLKRYLPDYTGGDDVQAAVQAIEPLFLAENKKGRSIYVHLTCATDTEGMKFVFGSMKDALLSEALKNTGFT